MECFNLMLYLGELGFGANDMPSPEEVKRRWKDLCKKHHPDKGGDPIEFRRITHAYKMITDPEYRNRELVNSIKAGNPNARGDLNIRIQVAITFDEAFFGCTRVVSYNRLYLDKDFNPILNEHLDVMTERIEVPPGSFTGFEYVAQGKGHCCDNVCGSALMAFTTLTHQRFQARSPDIVAQEQIPLETTLKGGTIEVLTMYGLRGLRIPPGTAPGQELKIKGCGVNKRGNHIVLVSPIFPSQEQLKTEIWKGLNIDWKKVEEEDKVDKEEEGFMNIFYSSGGQSIFFTNR